MTSTTFVPKKKAAPLDLRRIPPVWVLGFAITGSRVLLIRKQRPHWQRGLLNGLGGRIAEGESTSTAMRREFREETGVDIPEHDWFEFCRLVWSSERLPVAVFRTFNVTALEAETQTDEKVGWYECSPLPDSCVDNLHWLLPMATSKTRVTSAMVVEDR